jgi:response regulator RpfG family c-di-GMP phosphodiesterase/signal transduction histidine kinase
MLKFFQEDNIESKKISQLSKWKILIVDDEKEVHITTESVLKKFIFEDRGLEFLHAYSKEEALKILKKDADIALVLLDVVMESDDAGLKVVKYIREELNNKNIRIVLRTGQPGDAPEKDVIKQYDINDYKEKTELTSTKLYTTVISSLRAYRDMITIHKSKEGLIKIVDATKSLFSEKSLVLFTEGILTQIVSLINLNNRFEEGKYISHFITLENNKFNILSTTSKDEDKTISQDVSYLLYEALENKKSFFRDDIYIGYYESDDNQNLLLYLEGCLNLSDIEKNLLKMFSQNISIAFNNLCLHDELINTQSEVIRKLGEVIESRSKETAHHVTRVAKSSYILAKAYGLSEEESKKIKFASPMHDVGKVAIEDSILLKPGKLTKDEFKRIQEHSMIGYEILKDSNREILKTAAIIARDHHEKWDGSGYPNGLKGEEISIYGRITAVADVFDALSHDRVYKKAWALKDVIEFFKDKSGKDFEPKIVELLLENLDEITGKKSDTIKVEYGGNQYIKNIKLDISSLKDENLKKLLFEDNETKLVIGFISPNIDFIEASKKISGFFKDIKVVLCSTAGELCNINRSLGTNIYLDANDNWNTMVLQSFSQKLINDIDIYSIDLKNEDILNKNITKSTKDRVSQITQEINSLDIKTDIDYKKHVGLTLIDGLSNSESFFTEAIYRSGKFPCNIIGGSSGGSINSKKTYIFDSKTVKSNHAIIVLLELNKNINVGIFKTQNYEKTKHSFLIVDADPATRVVKTIKRKDSDIPENIVDYFCEIFKCDASKLEKKFTKFSLGLEIEDELYIRSVSSVDIENKEISFYIDIDFGDELYLCRMIDFKKITTRDFNEFLKEKDYQQPIAGIIFDCILRRLYNKKNISKLRTFNDIPFIGFSTFGECLGINTNQTLTSIFFFEKEKSKKFKDKFSDNFILHYSNYQNFFRERELKRLKSKELKNSFNALSTLHKELEDRYIELESSKKKLIESEKMASLGSMVAGVAHEINTPVGMALTGASYLLDEVKNLQNLYKQDRLSENNFIEFMDNCNTLCSSMQNNLYKASNLVKSFKQVSVDQSSDEDREFYLKKYIEEILISIHNEIKKRDHNIVIDIDEDIKLKSNPGAFSQIITNFIMNSFIHAFDDNNSGEIKISALDRNGILTLIYEDNGKGLNDEQKAKIFEPFFTTNRSNGGSGLGMNIVYNIITNKLGGTIDVESSEGNGVKFTLKFKNLIFNR